MCARSSSACPLASVVPKRRTLCAPGRMVRAARPRSGSRLGLAIRNAMNWEILLERPSFVLRRSGRYLVAELARPLRVISTSVENGGQTDHVRYLMNHQSCEGAGHHELHRLIDEIGHDGYHRKVCGDASAAGADRGDGHGRDHELRCRRGPRPTERSVTAVVTGRRRGQRHLCGRPGATGARRMPAWRRSLLTPERSTRCC